MTPAQFRAALRTLGWSQARAARELGACNHQRVSEWCRGARAIPRAYSLSLAAHVQLAACSQARDQARELTTDPQAQDRA